VYAQKLIVDVVIGGERKPCPLEWLDSFSMRNFTNSAEFDETLPPRKAAWKLVFAWSRRDWRKRSKLGRISVARAAASQ
jgi:hypothetical protein